MCIRDRDPGSGQVERLRINPDGQVLIGTDTDPAYSNRRLTVATTSGTTAIEVRSATNGDGRIYFTDNTTSGNVGAYAGKVMYDHTDNYMSFYTGGDDATPGERLRILSGGGVGIGASLYHLGDTNTFLNFGTDTMTLKTGGSTRIYLDNNYPTWIRRDAAGISTTALLLNHATNASGNGVGIAFAPTQNYTSRYCSIEAVNQDGNNNMYLTFKTVDSSQSAHGIERLRILSTGQVGIGTAAPGSPLEVLSLIHISEPTRPY